MAAGPATQIADIVEPTQFSAYQLQRTMTKSALVTSGVLTPNDTLTGMLASGGGRDFEVPSWRDLDDDPSRVPTDDASFFYGGGADPDPQKIESSDEKAVRLQRNNSWSAARLAGTLAGSDPLGGIEERVARYWDRDRQKDFVAMISGIIADNEAPPTGDDTHVQGDLVHDASIPAYAPGVTDFNADNFILAQLTMGDAMDQTNILMVHSVVYANMKRNNLIDFIPDARGETMIETYLGHRVIVDDQMPGAANVYESWLMIAGAMQLGAVSPDQATAIERHEGAGNGGGQDVLWSRVEYSMHLPGHRYIGSTPAGGPGPGTGANDLNNAGSWSRRYPERKQIALAVLRTKEA